MQIHKSTSPEALEKLWRNSIFLGHKQFPNELDSTSQIEKWLDNKVQILSSNKIENYDKINEAYSVALREVAYHVSLTSIELSY